MKLLSNLKGYFKRLTTPKKDTKYTPEIKVFGDYDIEIISSVCVHSIGQYIFRITYEFDKEDIVAKVEEFRNLLAYIDIITINYHHSTGKSMLYIKADQIQLSKLTEIINTPQYDGNLILKSFYKFILDIDLVHKQILGDDKDYYPFETKIIDHDFSESLLLQEYNLDYELDIHDFFQILTVFDVLKDRLVYEYLYYYHSLPDKDRDELYIDNRDHLFIPGFKNVLDINFTVTNNNSMPFNEDIDEIITQ